MLSEKKNNITSWIGISPSFLLFAVFLLFPVCFAVVSSFFNWSGVGSFEDFVGFGNYYSLIFRDETFRISLLNTFLLSILALVFQVFLGFIIASLIQKIRFRTFFRVVLLLPLALPMVAVGITWNMIYSPGIGLLNLILSHIPGLSVLGNIVWLGDPRTALISVLISYTWQYIGLYVAIFLAALQGVPTSYYESAQIDGANVVQQLFYITIPCTRFAFFVCSLLCVVMTARLFPMIYVMTMGGPGKSTEILGYTIHKYGFRFFRAGEANAIAVILMLLVIFLTVILNNLLKSSEEQRGGLEQT